MLRGRGQVKRYRRAAEPGRHPKKDAAGAMGSAGQRRLSGPRWADACVMELSIAAELFGSMGWNGSARGTGCNTAYGRIGGWGRRVA